VRRLICRQDQGPFESEQVEGSNNPQAVVGGEVGASGAIQVVHKPTLKEAFNAIIVTLPLGVDLKVGVGGGVTVGDGTFGLSGGVGIGGTIKTGNQTTLTSSYSFTYKERDNINSMLSEDPQAFRVSGQSAIKDNAGNITGWKGGLEVFGQDSKGSIGWHGTGINISSGNSQATDKSGNVTNNLSSG
jgi:hypothetical protein